MRCRCAYWEHSINFACILKMTQQSDILEISLPALILKVFLVRFFYRGRVCESALQSRKSSRKIIASGKWYCKPNFKRKSIAVWRKVKNYNRPIEVIDRSSAILPSQKSELLLLKIFLWDFFWMKVAKTDDERLKSIQRRCILTIESLNGMKNKWAYSSRERSGFTPNPKTTYQKMFSVPSEQSRKV